MQVPDGLGVRIPGFHPGGPGSIPGLGVLFRRPLKPKQKYKISLHQITQFIVCQAEIFN